MRVPSPLVCCSLTSAIVGPTCQLDTGLELQILRQHAMTADVKMLLDPPKMLLGPPKMLLGPPKIVQNSSKSPSCNLSRSSACQCRGKHHMVEQSVSLLLLQL